MSETQSLDATGPSGGTATRKLRKRAVVASGIGFFTDAYDLFVIGIVSTLLKGQWHLGTGQLALLNAVMLGAAFLGALCFGRLADSIGRTRVYWISAALMVLAAIGSALSPSLLVLTIFRFLLGFGVGGDYPVTSVLVSEYAHHGTRGRQVGLVFSAQAVGLIVGPLLALAFLGGGLGAPLTWRLLLGVGAIPAAVAVWLRRKLPESDHFTAAAAKTAAAKTAAAKTPLRRQLSRTRPREARHSRGPRQAGAVSSPAAAC